MIFSDLLQVTGHKKLFIFADVNLVKETGKPSFSEPKLLLDVKTNDPALEEGQIKTEEHEKKTRKRKSRTQDSASGSRKKPILDQNKSGLVVEFCGKGEVGALATDTKPKGN